MQLSSAVLLGGLALSAAFPLPGWLSRSSMSSNLVKGKWFDRFVVIVYENNNKDVTYGEPYWRDLTHAGMLLGSYHGTTHPSQPNYITMISNTDAAGVFDDADHNTTQSSIVDLFEPAGISWKAYMEGYKPLANGECNPVTTIDSTNYARKHNPFISFDNIRNNTSRCQKIVNAEAEFAKDVSLGASAPQYMYYTPNLLNDAHNTNVSYAAPHLKSLIDTMLPNADFMKNTLIVVTYDENDIYTPHNFGTPNLIYTLLLGNDTVRCYDCIDQQYYNHFSQVVTLEKNWNLNYIPQLDGSGEGWDQWWLPFSQLRTSNEPAPCAYAPCYEYYNDKNNTQTLET